MGSINTVFAILESLKLLQNKERKREGGGERGERD